MDVGDAGRVPYRPRTSDVRPQAAAGPNARPDARTEVPSAAERSGAGPRSANHLLPSVALPKSGGAIQGLGEKASVNAANGSATITIPLPLSAGRSGFTPKLDLSYDSGSGNGLFGIGWTLAIPAITRKTDKGLPRYRDSEESDVFILSGAEDLVPVLDATGARRILRRTVFGTDYKIYFYRPRIDSLYARIERWVATGSGLTHWRSISRDNVTTLYGYDDLSRVSDPADRTQIFSWRVSRSWDDKGQCGRLHLRQGRWRRRRSNCRP